MSSPDTARLACQGTLPSWTGVPPMILVRSEDRESLDFMEFTLDFTALRNFFSPEDFFVVFLLLFFFLTLPFLLVTSGWPHLQLTSPEPEPELELELETELIPDVRRTQDTEHLHTMTMMMMMTMTMMMMFT